MAIDHLTITIYSQGNLWKASFSPSDYTQGVSTEGAITFQTSEYEYDLYFSLLNGPDESYAENLGEYGFKKGIKTYLKTAFPGIDLAGKYLYSDVIGGAGIPIVMPYSNAGAPTSPKVAQTVSREAVELSWGAGSAGTGNSVTGYDVQYRESSDGSSWGSWTTASGSPVTGTKLSVVPSGTVGNYRQYRVRTRGSAGNDYYSDWVVSTNTLRRKWDAFGAWTDATLTAGVSGIRAVNLTQLQERVAVIRAFYGMAAYSFTAVTARKTKIAKWAALIGEIRTAIDQITTGHEAWNTLEAGKPRIAHISQLRRIIDNL